MPALALRAGKFSETEEKESAHSPERERSNESSPEGRFDLNLSRDDEDRNCCPFPWHFMGITPTGHVQPCGFWFRDDLMGNLFRQTFEEIWTKGRYEKLRNGLLKGRLNPSCRSCPASGMGSVNDTASFSVQNPF